MISKNKKILIIWYEYDTNKSPEDFIITDYQLYDMTQDMDIIKNDFKIIKNKVMKGCAHTLSEGDTSYLGACTKARTSADLTTQPNSDQLAKPRAYSLKQWYLNGILRSINFTSRPKQEYKTVLEYVYSKFKKYFGKTQLEIYEELFDEIPKTVPKHISKMLSDKILGKDKDLKEKNDLFKKTNYLIKNIPITKRGPKERMAFRNLTLSEFEKKWDDSDWKEFFEENTFITICYMGDSSTPNGDRILHSIKQVTFNDNDLNRMKITYEEVQKTIQTRNLEYLPTPSSFEGQILEIAPKTPKGTKIYETFLETEHTKVCFMLNKRFLNKKLHENDILNNY